MQGATLTTSKFMNALELELIFRLSSMNPTSKRIEQERASRASGARNRMEAALGRANTQSLNQAPLVVAAQHVAL
jgi:hypothetical protein